MINRCQYLLYLLLVACHLALAATNVTTVASDHQEMVDQEQLELCDAVSANNATLVEELLNKGYLDVNWRDPRYYESCLGYIWYLRNATALHLATQSNSSFEIVSMLIAAGADVNAKDESKFANPPLNIAATLGNAAVVKLLLDHGADVNGTNTLDENAAMFTAGNGSSTQVIQLLLSYGINAAQRDIYGQNALFAAAYHGFVEAVPLLLKAGCPIDEKTGDANSSNWNALMVAAFNGHSDVASILITNGADINARDNYGTSALALAAQNGSVETIKLFLNAGFPIDAVDSFGWTALMRAAWRGHRKAAKALIDRDCNFDIKSERSGSICNSCSALMIAAKFNHTDVVSILVESGADSEGCINSDALFNDLCP